MTVSIVKRRWAAVLMPLGLLIYALPVLLVSGIVLYTLLVGGEGTLTDPADTLRRARNPQALAVHIIGGLALSVMCIIQITPGLRLRYPRWHRWSGRGLVVAGVALALTGLLLNASPAAMAASVAYDMAQNVAAVALIGCLIAGVIAIRRKAVARHRVWMIRSYAICLAAATQTIALLPVFLVFGPPNGLVSDIVVIGAWPFNLLVGEWAMRRKLV
jgi:uncharacterized membrane protein